MKHRAFWLGWIGFCLFQCPISSVQSQKVLAPTGADHINILRLDSLNSPFRETNLSVSPDGRYLFWMSSRGGQTWSQLQMVRDRNGMKRHDGDIWYAEKVSGSFSSAEVMAPPVNTSNGEDEPNISPQGRYVYYQSWAGWDKSGGPYYRAEFNGRKWGKRKGLGGGIHAFFRKMMQEHQRAATDGMSLSPDGRTFIVAAGPNYEGAMDLYMSRKGSKGWSSLKKLSISTKGDERSAFLAADGQTLYFASNGHGGAGGLDIFKTEVKPDGTCGPITNVGAPFNTPEDDYNLVLTAGGNEAYFIREGDIYFADLTAADDSIKPLPSLVLKGTVTDSLEGSPIPAVVALRDSATKKILQKEKTHPTSGEFLFVVPRRATTYTLEIKTPTYGLSRRHIPIRPSHLSGEIPLEVLETVRLKPEIKTVENPNSLVADSDTALFVYFDSDVDSLDEAALAQMQEIIGLMKQYKAAQVKLLGHTDAQGDEAYNLSLSQRRVQSVAQYLLGKKYPAKRIVASHFGEAQPAAENSTSRGMQLNRRVEVRFRVRE